MDLSISLLRRQTDWGYKLLQGSANDGKNRSSSKPPRRTEKHLNIACSCRYAHNSEWVAGKPEGAGQGSVAYRSLVRALVECSGYVFVQLAPLPRGEWQTRLVSALPCDGQNLAKATL